VTQQNQINQIQMLASSTPSYEAQYGTVVNPLIISIDPTTGAASLNGQIQFARYGSSSIFTANSVTGNLYACDGLIYLTFDFGTYGLIKLALQKL
jgi:hypothetical protein